jgi:flagellar basal body-associated protein FliL
MMSWWIWLLLVVFMLVMLIVGVVFVVWRGLALMRTVSSLGATIERRLAPASTQEERAPLPRPVFTEPLTVASDRYTDAQAEVLARRETKHRRHMAQWERWLTINHQ